MDDDEAQRRRTLVPDDAEAAMALALNRLASRARTRAEIERVLLQKGYAPAVVDGVLKRLVELRYLDDARFAQATAQTLLQSRRLAPLEVERRLLEQGLSPRLVGEALREAVEVEGFSPLRAARALLESKGRGRGQSLAEKARDYRFLVSRGYSPEVALDAVGAGEAFDD